MSKRRDYLTMRSRVPTPMYLAAQALAEARGEPMARLIERAVQREVDEAKRTPSSDGARPA